MLIIDELFLRATILLIFSRIHIVAKSACWLRHVRLSARISTALTGRISMKFNVENSHENVLRRSKFGYKWAEVLVTLHEYPGMFCWWQH